jgi:oxygen-dependent protoporphyrinogen oxidase
VTHVVVVGGGIAGLAAAHEVVRQGGTVTLVEKDERVGGKLRTSPFAGRLVDDGADAFLLRVPWASDLCREVGIEGELVHPAARDAYVWSRGALRPMPPQLMGVPTDLDALEASGLVSPAGVEAARRDLTAPATPLAGDEAIAAAIGRRLGDEVVERLVDPLVGGINAGDTRALSLAAVVPQLDAALRDPEHASLIEAPARRAGPRTRRRCSPRPSGGWAAWPKRSGPPSVPPRCAPAGRSSGSSRPAWAGPCT